MGKFAVIDTETNWYDAVMSIGCCLADEVTFAPQGLRYHILTPEYTVGGMYAEVLGLETPVEPRLSTRREAMEDLRGWLASQGVTHIYAYNARFDKSHLPELGRLVWHDIMALAAYRQYNPRISPWEECCSTGRLRRSYGVEPMLRRLSGNPAYRETHNALRDAMDELEIMRLLGHWPDRYPQL